MCTCSSHLVEQRIQCAQVKQEHLTIRNMCRHMYPIRMAVLLQNSFLLSPPPDRSSCVDMTAVVLEIYM